MDKNYKDSTTLIFKNIPNQIDDLSSLLNSLNIPAKEVKPFGRKRALLTYELRCETEKALDTLRGLEFAGKTPNVAWFCKDKPAENKVTPNIIKRVNKCVQTVEETNTSCVQTQQQINKYVQKLYALEGDLGFHQPPPPYLKYNYPPIDKDIMDNICISLLSNKRFYTQVLHLMNRMNLEPPFGARKCKLKPPGKPKDVSTQTDIMFCENPVQSQSKDDEVETELETSEDEVTQKNRPVPPTQLKRKLPANEEQYKKKARQMLQNVQKQSKEQPKKTAASSNLSLKEIFDKPDISTTSNTTKIEFQMKRIPIEEVKKSIPTIKPVQLPLDLKTQKLSQEDLCKLPIYKNYQRGEPSNKLYIKNLHKDVTTEDLTSLYERYLTSADSIKLDVKVMQHGRMKGQAFVTFQGDQMVNVQNIVAQALDDTNGFILRDKPMVVCYGKSS